MPINDAVSWSHWLGSALIIVAAGYACFAAGAVLRRPRAAVGDPQRRQPASVLKPLHGAEPALYENLRSLCRQLGPDDQVVFGLHDEQDPALAVVARLREEFPQARITPVVDPRVHGANRKVSNLINMLPHARHECLVLADSDISVPMDYLGRVTAPLADPAVGIVTCLYRGVPRQGFWSRLGRLFIDDWFVPSVYLAHWFGSSRFGFGSTIALRREALAAIGGFEALRDTLADDFWLGELTRRRGLRTVLSDLVVETDVAEPRLAMLWTHEIRWLRTIRALAPLGFVGACVGFTTPWLLFGLLLAPGKLNAVLALIGAGARALLYFFQRRRSYPASPWHEVLLVPLRDGLLLLEWAVALTGWRVRWRDEVLHARSNGSALRS